MAPRVAWTIFASPKYEGNLLAERCDEVAGWEFIVAKGALALGGVRHGDEASGIGTVGVAGEAYCVCASTRVPVENVSWCLVSSLVSERTIERFRSGEKVAGKRGVQAAKQHEGTQ